MNGDRSDILNASLARGAAFLETTLTAPPSEIQRAAAIQAFECTYDLTVHTYDEGTAQQVYEVISGGFLQDVRAILDAPDQ